MDPHDGCGPLTRALYFMCDGASSDSSSDSFSPLLPEGMAGIGNDKTAKIWYRALTTYLTPESDYMAARAAALRAAEDLFPNSAREADAVRKAFAAINVGDKEASVDELGIPAVTTAVAVHKNLLDLRVRPSHFKVNRFHRVNEVDYFVDDILLATSFTPPLFRVTLDTTRLLANGDHVMTARAFSPEANEGASLPRRFHLDNRTQQVLRDPGLEGSDAWQGDTGPVLTTDESGTDPHGGYRYARFDPAAEPRKLALHQRVAIPPAGQVEFSLWVRTRPGAAKDASGALALTVRDSGAPGGPAVLETLRRFTGSDPADWTRSSFDLSAYAGRTVELWLEADFAGGDGAAFWVDDLALVCSDQAPAKAGLDRALLNGAFGEIRRQLVGGGEAIPGWGHRHCVGVGTALDSPASGGSSPARDSSAMQEPRLLVATRQCPWSSKATCQGMPSPAKRPGSRGRPSRSGPGRNTFCSGSPARVTRSKRSRSSTRIA
jgi:hypothetical protein